MAQLGLKANFKHKVLQWDDNTVSMKKTSGLLGKSNLTKRNMREVVMQNSEPASIREATQRMVKIIDITYAKVDLKQVADNATQLNAE